MFHIKNLEVGPPGGWKYTQSESGFTISGITYGQLLKKVAAHRQANGYPTEGDLGQEIQEAICGSLSLADQCETCEGGMLPAAQRVIRWSDIARFMGVMKTWIGKQGDKFVDAGEAGRRAAICAACPYNQPVRGCKSCHTLLEEISKAVAGRTTEHDAGLFGCSICGCANKVQVHAPEEVLRAGVTDETVFPQSCWKGALLKPE